MLGNKIEYLLVIFFTNCSFLNETIFSLSESAGPWNPKMAQNVRMFEKTNTRDLDRKQYFNFVNTRRP